MAAIRIDFFHIVKEQFHPEDGGQVTEDRAFERRFAPLCFFCLLSPVLCLLKLVELTGIEPVTSCLQSRRSPS
jgi:hypothetical protein